MNKYELTVILRSQERESLTEKVKEILGKHDAAIVNESSWGIKKLAYEILGEKEGYYFFANIEAAPDAVEKIRSEFGLNAGLLRSLFVKQPETKRPN